MSAALGLSRLSIRRNVQAGTATAIFLLAVGLRFFRIGYQGPDPDELFSLVVSQLPFRQMIHQIVLDFVHPPLHYLMLHGLSEVIGLGAANRTALIADTGGSLVFGLAQARLLSAAFDSMTVVIAFFFARYLLGRRTALISSLLLAISQQSLAMAQEARPYALFGFLVLLSSYLLVRALQERRAIYWWGFVGTSTLMIYTHYYGILVIATLALYVVIYRKHYQLRASWLWGGIIIILLLYTPWIVSVLPIAANSLKTFSGRLPFFSVRWSTPLATLNAFNNGQSSGISPPAPSPPWWAFIAGGLLLTLPVALAVKRALVGNREAVGAEESLHPGGMPLLSMLFFLPVCIVIGSGFVFHVQFQVRYVLFCAPFYYMLAGWEISRLASSARRWAVAWVLLIGIVAFSANSLRADYFTSWKGLGRAPGLAYVEADYKKRDCGIFAPFSLTATSADPILWRGNLRDRPSFEVIGPDPMASELGGCGRVWLASFIATRDWSPTPLEATYSKTQETIRGVWAVVLYARKGDAGDPK
jgi:4-amino-4-deoxy-L-arabinose transferase-like glycosyltransferase